MEARWQMLNLTLTISDEIAALKRFLEYKITDMNRIRIEQSESQTKLQQNRGVYHQSVPQKNGVGTLGLLIAFAVGLGFDGDDC